ncbi:bifunctional aldolase/short-chain dehydrogenase [Pseudorhodoplanes sp.]|uniref:bifunctional aldolase/short-chain dehydrogenase n=1 Tax=Pseudorhodoplanes sp. TaxID=1934341 RepID=UPI003918C61B
MKSAWVESDARELVSRYEADGIAADLALRVYTTRLLGRDPKLVLHGGGNTSLKTRTVDLNGEPADVLCVKGSGWDMDEIEPAGLPAVRLDNLRKARAREALSDEDMVALQRVNLIDPMAPNPSVETLLHAFLPHRFVDHTHATAVLGLVDQEDSRALCEEVYGPRMGFVRYIMPGFALAKEAANVFDADPAVEGLILDKHGIFTFGETAREAYERMIEMVTLAEMRLAQNRKTVFVSAQLPNEPGTVAEIAPVLRGAVALPDPHVQGAWKHLILDFRSSDAILNFVNGEEVARYATAGVITPDHTIRTKNWPMIAPAPDAENLARFRETTRETAAVFVERYAAYFTRNNARTGGIKTMLDPAPRVILVPGVGLFGLGRSKKAARIAADLAEAAVEAITEAEAIGRYTPIGETDMFDVEYWSLEQAKLGGAQEPPLAGQVAAITGAAGAIGSATARAFSAAGAEVVLLDIDSANLVEKAKALGALSIRCDVTDDVSVRAAFDRICETFGGVDIVVSNAGAAFQGRIGDVDDATLRQSFELNFFAHQRVAQNAVRIMLAQGSGGCLLFNASKQAINPGPDFGPYGLPKAATLLLVRQYALDYGADGIRSNAVNADRIRSGLLTDDFIAARARARGLSETDYMAGNLLRREVTADDVAQAFLHQALALKTTANVTTVDGGNIAAALR